MSETLARDGIYLYALYITRSENCLDQRVLPPAGPSGARLDCSKAGRVGAARPCYRDNDGVGSGKPASQEETSREIVARGEGIPGAVIRCQRLRHREPDETMASVTTDDHRCWGPKVPKASEYAASELASQSTIRRVNAPATMPSRNALESARKRNVLMSSSQASQYRLSSLHSLRAVSG